MADVASQLPALIGVVVGAVLSYGGAALTERNKWKRSQEVRWDSRRVEAYAQYGAAVKRQARLCQRIAGSKGLGPRSDHLEASVAEPLLAEAREERSLAFEAVALLGDNATVIAARDWNNAVSDLYHLLTGTDASEAQFLEFFQRAHVQRDRYYEAARASLQVGADRLEPAPEIAAWRSLDPPLS